MIFALLKGDPMYRSKTNNQEIHNGICVSFKASFSETIQLVTISKYFNHGYVFSKLYF